jgi:2-succinyl-5-enolpyruvyl-6-hydroxy-3-cyclohexene-1-carboxylate synthase
MSQFISDKLVVNHIVEHCHAHGVKYVIISPGSRNAPLILSFPASKKFTCLTIVDERSAGYFALGISCLHGTPVALICTSGTAVLNYAPALAEAFYQQIPLIAITADRPPELIDQADGQTIRQDGVFSNFVRYQCQLPFGDLTKDDEWLVDRMLNEAFHSACGSVQGPVHINVPFREPLYKKVNAQHLTKPRIVLPAPLPTVNLTAVEELASEIGTFKKVLFLVGAVNPDSKLIELVTALVEKGVVVVTESLSNLPVSGTFGNTDRVIEGFKEGDASGPDLLITLDVPVLSKKMKQFLRNNSPKVHWHFSNQNILVDTYRCLTRQIKGDAVETLLKMVRKVSFFPSDYFQLWQAVFEKTTGLHQQFLQDVSWSDFLVFGELCRSVPEPQEIHFSNSTPVRYAQLFEWRKEHSFFANRGTSGIDGCVSAAAGAAYARKQPVTLITGDLAFFYDSNGLWHSYLPASFRVIVINNGGGGIFRFLPGPSESKELEPFFEAKRNYRCKGIAETFGMQYYTVAGYNELKEILTHFWDDKGGPALLEIFTPPEENGEILRWYFRKLKE